MQNHYHPYSYEIENGMRDNYKNIEKRTFGLWQHSCLKIKEFIYCLYPIQQLFCYNYCNKTVLR